MTAVVLGEALVDLVEQSDGSFKAHLGGSPFNVAIGLSRQAAPVRYLSPLSSDIWGDRLHCALLQAGVNPALHRRSVWPTSLAFVTLRDGLPSYRLYRQGIADKDISFDEIVDHLPDDWRLFHTGSLALTPSQLPTIRRLVELAGSANVCVSIDINIRQGAAVDEAAYHDGVMSLLPFANIVKASDEDLLALGFEGDPVHAAKAVYMKMNGGIVVFTQGEHGALIYHSSGELCHPGYEVANVVDAVGAGDTFHSTFLATLIHEKELTPPSTEISPQTLEKALDRACAAAALNVTNAGCVPPTTDEIENFLTAPMLASKKTGDPR